VNLHDVLAGLFATRLVDRLSVVNRRVVGAVVPCQNVLPQREILEGEKNKKEQRRCSFINQQCG